MASLRLILALACKHRMHLRSLDVTAAFTNGDLDEIIYMKQPEGFRMGSSNTVCKLHKALYGLKQAARQWNKKLHEVLSKMGFSRLESDRSIYVYVKGDVRVIIPIYIDDAFSGINGLNLPTQVSDNPAIENMSYNGWLHEHFTSCVLVFSAKGG